MEQFFASLSPYLAPFDLVPRDALVIPVMVVVFLVYWKLLGNSVVAPFVSLHELRESRTVGAHLAAESKVQEAETIKTQYQTELTQKRAAIMKQAEPRFAEAKRQAAQLVESAEAEAAAILESTRQEIQRQSQALKGALESESESLAETITAKLAA